MALGWQERNILGCLFKSGEKSLQAAERAWGSAPEPDCLLGRTVPQGPGTLGTVAP